MHRVILLRGVFEHAGEVGAIVRVLRSIVDGELDAGVVIDDATSCGRLPPERNVPLPNANEENTIMIAGRTTKKLKLRRSLKFSCSSFLATSMLSIPEGPPYKITNTRISNLANSLASRQRLF